MSDYEQKLIAYFYEQIEQVLSPLEFEGHVDFETTCGDGLISGETRLYRGVQPLDMILQKGEDYIYLYPRCCGFTKTFIDAAVLDILPVILDSLQ